MDKGCLSLIQQMIFQINPSMEFMSSDLKVSIDLNAFKNYPFLARFAPLIFQSIFSTTKMLSYFIGIS